MNNAPAQLLGYTLQLQRALVFLLQSGPESKVCIEVVGDVGLITEDSVVSEEDKSSVVSNPVTNKSVDLWKTFSNWITSIENSSLDVDKTKFILYSNHAGNKGIVDSFSDAITPEEIDKAIKGAQEKLSDLNQNHEIWPYFQKVYKNETLFKKVLANFEFIVGSKCSSDEVHDELIKKLIPATHISFVHDALLGWLTNVTMEKIAKKEQAIILWEDYRHNFSNLYERVRSKALIDFTLNQQPDDYKVKSELNKYPYYIQQLNIINLDEADQVKAVSDYLRSKINIDKWIESEVIDTTIAKDLEERLKRFWESTTKRIAITNKDIQAEERGQLVYYDCIARSETLSDQTPPVSTISGIYQALADEDEIGWHESWKKILEKSENSGSNG